MPRSPSPDYKRSSHRSRHDESSRSDRKRHREDEDDPRGRSRRDDDNGRVEKRHRETSTERRERKAAKAEQKLRKKAEEERQRRDAADLNYYAAEPNPFHDANLGQQFVWGKKHDKDKKSGLSFDEATRRDQARRQDAKNELEQLNRRRAEREVEMAKREEDQARMLRDQESAQMADWIAREDEFHLEQARKRAEIRVRERRAKPIDYLALDLKWSVPQPEVDEEDEGEGLDADLEEPYAIFDNLTLEDTQELEGDIKMYLSLEKSEAHLDFWRSMLLVCASVLENLQSQRTLGHAQFAEQNRASAGVKAEISTLLRGKTHEQLTALQGQVMRKLKSNEPIDTDYWENLLKELIVWKAKAKLRDMHEIVLRNRLEQLRRRQRDEARQVQRELARKAPLPDLDLELAAAAAEVENEPVDDLPDPYDRAMSPDLITRLHQDERSLVMLLEDDDRADLVKARRVVAEKRFVPKKRGAAPSGPTKDEVAQAAFVEQENEKELDEEEELFNMEEEMNKQTYMWEDKYRPRKPRYYNKVLTGFEWNKYNQTHYDADNPPPKVVQGYKFNIFLPDLIDKTKAPQFKVEKQKDDEDTALLVFKCGPPYEDLAFRIVNREFEYSHRKGFRCSFDRGVLQLWFQFKRIQYRK